MKVNIDINLVSSESDALTDLKIDKNYQSKLSSYNKALSSLFKNQENVIGVVAVAGDQVIGGDLFAQPEIFKKHYANLLQSYAAEAMMSKELTFTEADVHRFWENLIRQIRVKNGFMVAAGESGNRNHPIHYSILASHKEGVVSLQR